MKATESMVDQMFDKIVRTVSEFVGWGSSGSTPEWGMKQKGLRAYLAQQGILDDLKEAIPNEGAPKC